MASLRHKELMSASDSMRQEFASFADAMRQEISELKSLLTSVSDRQDHLEELVQALREEPQHESLSSLSFEDAPPQRLDQQQQQQEEHMSMTAFLRRRSKRDLSADLFHDASAMHSGHTEQDSAPSHWPSQQHGDSFLFYP